MVIDIVFQNTAIAFGGIIMMPLMLFGGFFANAGTYPGYITWIQYVSPIRYTLESLFWNEFNDNTTYYHLRRDPLKMFAFDLGKWQCILYLAILAIGTRFMALIFLRLLVQKLQ